MAAKVTVAGTVATVELLELKFTVSPLAGAGDDSNKVRFCLAVPGMVAVFGKKLSVAVTLTV